MTLTNSRASASCEGAIMTSTARKERKATAQQEDRWKDSGWQGIKTRVPLGWNLVAFGGDHDSGNLRLDNGALDAGRLLGMEVRWNKVGPRFSTAQMDQRLNNYLGSIEKAARRQHLVSETGSKPLEPDADRTAEREFRWKADRKGVGRIWHCADCGRLVIAQVVGDRSENLDAIRAVVLGEMRCHSDAWESWALYDLSTSAPSDYRLHGKPQLLNVYVQLPFQQGQSTDTLTVEQWSVADMQLRRASLTDWFTSKIDLAAAGVVAKPVETELHGHGAYAFSGRRGGLRFWLGPASQQLVKLQRPATWYRAMLWECAQSNKIHLVQLYSRTEDTTVLDEVLRRTRCH
jgi:hypothetical protein